MGAFSEGSIFRIRGKGFRILYNFGQYPSDGICPAPKLALGHDGTLYGTTDGFKQSTIFKLDQNGNGFQTLFEFAPDSHNGSGAVRISADPRDGLVGTASTGGVGGRGTVFAVNTDGTHFRVLHSFGLKALDGAAPSAGVIVGTDGALYGTAAAGGIARRGTIFRVKADGKDFSVLHQFGVSEDDGTHPYSPLIVDTAGAVYGVTPSGGEHGSGVVFKINQDGASYEVLHSFDPEHGSLPYGSLVLATDGNLYGLVANGGSYNHGGVFRLRLTDGRFEIIHNFSTERASFVCGAAFLVEQKGRLYGAVPVGTRTSKPDLFGLPLQNRGG